MKRWIRQVTISVGVTLALVGIASSASAAVGQPLRASSPPGYQIVRDQFSAPPGLFDAGGQDTCPTGTVIWGGGVANDFQNGTINTSVFVGSTGWEARVNNNAADAEGFEIDAICANKPKGYTFVSQQIDDPAGAQVRGSATCPTGKVLLSGSVQSQGDTTNVYLLSAWPTGSHTFAAVQENASPTDVPFTVLALCATKPPGYAIVRVTQTASGGGGLVEPETYCASGSSVVGGGIQVVKPRPAADMSYSLVGSGTTFAWTGVVQDEAAASVKVTASVICAS